MGQVKRHYHFHNELVAVLDIIDGYSFQFYDVGAFAWFAHIIEWEFPNFSVEKCFSQLLEMQKMFDETGKVEGTIHRYLIIARK